MRNIAYIRVSSEKQNTARHRKALKEAGCNEFYEEKLIGKNTERPELRRMLSELREDDAVLVHEISLVEPGTRHLTFRPGTLIRKTLEIHR